MKNIEKYSLAHGGEIHLTHQRADYIAGYYADENGNYLYHALSPDIADYDDADSYQRHRPAGLAVVNRRTW